MFDAFTRSCSCVCCGGLGMRVIREATARQLGQVSEARRSYLPRIVFGRWRIDDIPGIGIKTLTPERGSLDISPVEF